MKTFTECNWDIQQGMPSTTGSGCFLSGTRLRTRGFIGRGVVQGRLERRGEVRRGQESIQVGSAFHRSDPSTHVLILASIRLEVVFVVIFYLYEVVHVVRIIDGTAKLMLKACAACTIRVYTKGRAKV
jgi:hypothetical protein